MDPERISNLMRKHFYNISSAQNYDSNFIPIKNNVENESLNFSAQSLSTYNEPITIKEVNAALKNSRKTSPGNDNLHYDMLKHLFTLLLGS